MVHRYPPVAHQGVIDYLPTISPIMLSPKYSGRFYRALVAGIDYLSTKEIPLLLLGLNIPIERERLPKAVIYEDISQYFGMSYLRFRSQFNLGWDGHFNSKGNQILARSILQSLQRNDLIDNVHIVEGRLYDKQWYWEAYN